MAHLDQFKYQMAAYAYFDAHTNPVERLKFTLSADDSCFVPTAFAYITREFKLDDPLLTQRLTSRLSLALLEERTTVSSLVEHLLKARFFDSNCIPITTVSSVIMAALSHDTSEPNGILLSIFEACSDMFTPPTLARKKVQVLCPHYLKHHYVYAKKSLELLKKFRQQESTQFLAISKNRGPSEYSRTRYRIQKQRKTLAIVEAYLETSLLTP